MANKQETKAATATAAAVKIIQDFNRDRKPLLASLNRKGLSNEEAKAAVGRMVTLAALEDLVLSMCVHHMNG